MIAITKKNNAAKSSLTKRAVQRFLANKMATISTFGLLLVIFACIFAPLITPHDPTFIDVSNRSASPDAVHWLGTDRLGRDIFARVLYGGRYSIAIGLAGSLLANTGGVILGGISGFFGGKVDSLLVSLQEFLSVFPAMLLQMLGIAIFGQNISVMLIVWTITGWGGLMRTLRSRIMQLRQEPFVESCRVAGVSNSSIMFRHIMPNTKGPIIIQSTTAVGAYMMSETALSYLGLGLPPEVPTWGNILNAARRLDIVQQEPMLWLAPGIAMCLFMFFLKFLGDGLRDALDPTMS